MEKKLNNYKDDAMTFAECTDVNAADQPQTRHCGLDPQSHLYWAHRCIKVIPRPLRAGKEFLNERSEFRNSGAGSCLSQRRIKPLTRICSSLRSHNCALPLKEGGKLAAFTLAEVLITLGIVGVVAAMTIPTLVQNYKKKMVVSRLQKVYSVFNNAFNMAKVVNGDFGTWSWNQIETDNGARTKYFWQTYGFPYLKIAKNCGTGTPDGCFALSVKTPAGNTPFTVTNSKHISFMLSDGTSVHSWAGNDSYMPHVWIYVDINGLSSPNIVGKDIFVLYFTPNPAEITTYTLDDDGNETNTASSKNQVYGFYGEGLGLNVEELLSPNVRLQQENSSTGSNLSCSTSGSGVLCGAAIKFSGWKIPDGYPEL